MKVWKRLFPGGIQTAMKRTAEKYIFSRTFPKFATLAPQEIPRSALFQQLWIGWGNQAYSAHPAYLETLVHRAMAVKGPILECGSGLTTLLLGLYAGQRNIPVWTLEHDQWWYNRMVVLLQLYHLPNIQLCYAPLCDYGEFFWCAAPLHRMPDCFDLVICDGPPKMMTPGDRYGLLPVMRKRLKSGAIILLDDVQITMRDKVLEGW